MIYRRGRYYWVRFKWRGALIRRSTRAENMETARAVEEVIRARLARQHAKNVRLGRIRGTALEAFGRDLRALGAKSRSAAGREPKYFPGKRSVAQALDRKILRGLGVDADDWERT